MLRCDALSCPYQVVGETAPSILNHDVILFCCERFQVLTWLVFFPLFCYMYLFLPLKIQQLVAGGLAFNTVLIIPIKRYFGFNNVHVNAVLVHGL